LVPEGSVEVVTVNRFGATASVIAIDFVCAGLLLSVTVAVKLKVPLTVGVPEITPLVRLTPDGRLPEVIDHV
jgi:hypothetical protein